LGRRLVPQDCGLEVEKSDDEFPAIVQRCDANEVSLKPHKSFAVAVSGNLPDTRRRSAA